MIWLRVWSGVYTDFQRDTEAQIVTHKKVVFYDSFVFIAQIWHNKNQISVVDGIIAISNMMFHPNIENHQL